METKKYKGFSVGQRVELARPVDRFPDFLVEAGVQGTVVTIDLEEELIEVKMDEPIENCEAWENCILWIEEDMEQFVEDVRLV